MRLEVVYYFASAQCAGEKIMLVRSDELTSQKIETALIFKQMLGIHDAQEYLRNRKVAPETIARVLSDGKRRASPLELASYATGALAPLPPRLNESFYSNSGRRKDVLRMAVVQAALALRAQLGDGRIEKMLKRESVPQSVITRVLCGEPGTLRVRGVVAPCS
jgi:hypothetical protein